ncbi:hypothetical protein FACS18949_11810 [Clostridia bacterium]|nr:hypothetical protein FACS18949_11810 [Clostridia bacterium]
MSAKMRDAHEIMKSIEEIKSNSTEPDLLKILVLGVINGAALISMANECLTPNQQRESA